MAVDFDSPGETVMAPAALAHIFLRTNNFETMVPWWKKFLGADARFESGRIAFLGYDHEHHRIAICAIPDTGSKQPQSAGLEHVAFTYNTLSDLALSYRQRTKIGIKPFWAVNHGITTSIYYKDPDGNQIETQIDNFDTNEEANDFMRTPEFKANPLGTNFEPEDLVRRLQSGEDEAAIKKRDENGPRGMPH